MSDSVWPHRRQPTRLPYPSDSPWLFTASEFTSITSDIHNWVLFLLWLFLFILSGVISPLFSSSILGTYWSGEFIFSILSFCLHTVHRVSWQGYWRGLPFPSPVDHILSELSTMTRLSWVALRSMAHSFIELDKAVVHVIRLVSFLWLVFSLCALWWRRIRGIGKLPDGRDWEGNWVLFWCWQRSI